MDLADMNVQFAGTCMYADNITMFFVHVRTKSNHGQISF